MELKKTWLWKNLNLLVILGIGLWIIIILQKKEDYVDKYNNQIQNLEQKVDSLHHLNVGLSFKISTLNTKIHKLDQELDLKNNKINNLRYEIRVKVDAVDTFSNSELERFFTERYKTKNPR